MDVLDMALSFEKHICDKADDQHIPIACTIELLPICNMDCNMCYVKMSKEDMEKQHHILSVEEWMKRIMPAYQKGLLFMVLTGGEPLLYPQFIELYKRLNSLGLAICVNTNGTLIDENIAKLFQQYPPRRINISVYGASDQQYERLCHNKKGFSQMMHGVTLLQQRGIQIKWNYSVTRENVCDIERIYALSSQYNIPVETAYYMFPPARKLENVRNSDHWLTPKEAAWVRVRSELYMLGENGLRQKAKTMLALSQGIIEMEKPSLDSSFTCRAASSTFWYNWKGEMMSCGMINDGFLNTDGSDFDEKWDQLIKWAESTQHPEKCTNCPYETVCVRCAAASFAEEQKYDREPEYVCELMKHYFKYVEKIEEDDSIDIIWNESLAK